MYLEPEEIKHLFEVFTSRDLPNIEMAMQIAAGSNTNLYLEHFESLFDYLIKQKVYAIDKEPSIAEKVCIILNIEQCKIQIPENEVNAALPVEFYFLKNLKELIIVAKSPIRIPQTLAYLEHLETLEMSLLDQETLPESIFEIASLTKLDLSFNVFTALPRTIWKLRNLRELHLNYCLQLQQIPNELFGLPNLEKVYLVGTPIYEISPSLAYSNIQIYSVGFDAEAKKMMKSPIFGRKMLMYSGGKYLYKFAKLFKLGMDNSTLHNFSPARNVPAAILEQGMDAVKAYLKGKK